MATYRPVESSAEFDQVDTSDTISQGGVPLESEVDEFHFLRKSEVHKAMRQQQESWGRLALLIVRFLTS